MKKLFSVLLSFSIIFLGTFVASCSCEEDDLCIHVYDASGTCAKCGDKNEKFKEGVDKSFTEDVTITFYHTMGKDLKGVLEEYILEFNELFPNIIIQHEQVGSYDDVRDTISTNIQADLQPNIAYCYPDHVASYNTSGKVVSLNQFINSTNYVVTANGDKYFYGLGDAEISNFIDAYYAEGTVYGSNQMYTLPFSKSTEVLYYNETFFTANGLNVPTHWFSSDANDTTSMEYVLYRIKEIDPTSIPLGYDSASNWFITMCEQLGTPYTSGKGDHYLFNTAENRAFIEKFRQWYQDGLIVTKNLNDNKAYTSNLFKETVLTNKKSYMTIGSTGGAKNQRPSKIGNTYPFNVGITTIPQANVNNPKVISQGPSVCIFEGKNITEEQVLASWLFIRYLTTSVRFQGDFSMVSGYSPVLKQEVMLQDTIFANFVNQADGGAFIESLAQKVALEQTPAYYTSPAFVGSSTARDQVGLLLESCISTTTNLNISEFINQQFIYYVNICNSTTN